VTAPGSLTDVASKILQQLSVPVGFHAFGDDGELQALALEQRLKAFGPGGLARDTHLMMRGYYSITSSASARRVEGTAMPSVLAVLRFITSSYLVGCRIGRSLGLAPLRSFPT
jgi:hypothetical protein